MTFSDFTAAGTLATANAEGLIGTISIPGGAHIIRCVISQVLGVGTVYAIRLDWAGIKTPQKYVLPCIYDSVGTEVQPMAIFSSEPIELDITLDANVSQVSIYGTADTNSTVVIAGLVWE